MSTFKSVQIAGNPSNGKFLQTDGTSNSWVAVATSKRSVTLTDAATVTPNADTTDQGILPTLSQSTTIANPSGTPVDGQDLIIRIKSTVSRALTFGTQYRASTTVSLPSATQGSSLTEYYLFKYNSADTKWDILAINVGF